MHVQVAQGTRSLTPSASKAYTFFHFFGKGFSLFVRAAFYSDLI
jgi:hypothetical protein